MLHPREGLRSSPVSGVVLTGGDVDVIAGLLTLRERQAFTLFATPRIHSVLDANSIFEVLARDIVDRRTIGLDQIIELGDGLTVELFAVPGCRVPTSSSSTVPCGATTRWSGPGSAPRRGGGWGT